MDLMSVYEEQCFSGALTPSAKEFGPQESVKEANGLQNVISMKLMDQLSQRNKLAINNHTILTNGNKLVALILLLTNLILIMTNNPHIKKLIGVTFLQQAHNLRYG
jgi:hypothetical protein